MATLLRADGTQEEVFPKSGKRFTLEELQTLIGGYIEVRHTGRGRFLVMDEDGKSKQLPVNKLATEIGRVLPYDVIVGNVLWAQKGEID